MYMYMDMHVHVHDNVGGIIPSGDQVQGRESMDY